MLHRALISLFVFLLSVAPCGSQTTAWTAIFAWTTCFSVTIVISLLTNPRPDGELKGLVYALTNRPKDEGLKWYPKPAVLAVVVLTALIVLNWIFW